jgi:hypothetical protein
MQIQLSDGRLITVTPPTGARLVKAQAWFGLRFKYLEAHPPTNEAGQRRVLAKIARALAPYVAGVTAAELTEAIYAAPYDITLIAEAVLGQLASVPQRERR